MDVRTSMYIEDDRFSLASFQYFIRGNRFVSLIHVSLQASAPTILSAPTNAAPLIITCSGDMFTTAI